MNMLLLYLTIKSDRCIKYTKPVQYCNGKALLEKKYFFLIFTAAVGVL